MILATLAEADRYCALHPLFARAFDFLRNTDLHALAPGKHVVQGEQIFAIVEACAGRTRAEAKLECHRRYIDIQLVLEGDEAMGWKPLEDCLNPVSEHSMEKDIRFFHDAPASYVPVPPDHFCIFFPEDAHAPLVARGEIRKVIFKVAVNPA